MSTKSYTVYGTLPTTTTTTTVTTPTFSSELSFLAQAKRASEEVVATRRPWRELFKLSSFSRPYGYADAMSCIRWNLSYFRVNYTMVMLFIVFLSLLWHPISMIVFLMIFVAWFFLYFFRNSLLVVFNRTVDDRVMLIGLSLITVLGVAYTHVGLNLLVAFIIGVVIVAFHAAFRVTEDLFLDEESAAEGGLLVVVGNQPLRPSYNNPI